MKRKIVSKFNSIVYRLISYFFSEHIVKILNSHHYVHGPKKNLHLGNNITTVNTIFNTSSGHIYLKDNVVFGHNCMLLTGRHDFYNGKRKILSGHPDTPTRGYDIKVGNGTWIASGAILIGGIEIGANCIVCSGAVVTKSFPDNSVIAGIPAKAISSTFDRG
jgi:acetyltransferase-like isoleucine patch superfamily enzyme